MAARVMVVRQCLKWHHHHHHHLLCFPRATLSYHLLSSSSKLPSNPKPNAAALRRLHFTSQLSAPQNTVDLGSRGLRFLRDSDGSEERDGKKTRNQLKRDCRRAVRWGMDLTSFSASRIKRILRVASIEQEPVYDAIIQAKSFGPDVREGKRRQFNYIGKLLRDAEPELMDALIQASKKGDHFNFLKICASSGAWNITDNFEYDDEGSSDNNPVVSRWLDGLIKKDIAITKEVYAINTVDFDRQELRRLVRKVHSLEEKCVAPIEASLEENKHVEASLMRAKTFLVHFLSDLAKKMQV